MQFGRTKELKRKAQDKLIKHAFGGNLDSAIQRTRLQDHSNGSDDGVDVNNDEDESDSEADTASYDSHDEGNDK